MKAQRNDPCPCGSGRKYKQCCLQKEQAKHPLLRMFEEQAGLEPGSPEEQGGVWETDLLPLAAQIQTDPTARPVLRLVTEGGVPIHFHVIGHVPTEPEAVARLLEDGILAAAAQAGAFPAEVHLRHPEVADALAERMAPREVEVVTVPYLPGLSAVAAALSQMGAGGPAPASAPQTWAGW